MIVLLALAQAVAAPPVTVFPLAAIGRQALPTRGCAAYLWSVAGDRLLVAMASAEPAQLRIALDGKPADYARTVQGTVQGAGQGAGGGFGFAQVSEYRNGDVVATLDMTISTSAALTQGAQVTEASLRIDRPGQDSLVVPVAGLIGCSA